MEKKHKSTDLELCFYEHLQLLTECRDDEPVHYVCPWHLLPHPKAGLWVDEVVLEQWQCVAFHHLTAGFLSCPLESRSPTPAHQSQYTMSATYYSFTYFR